MNIYIKTVHLEHELKRWLNGYEHANLIKNQGLVPNITLGSTQLSITLVPGTNKVNRQICRQKYLYT